MEQLNKRMEIDGISEVFSSDKGYFIAIRGVSPDINNDEFLVILRPRRYSRTVLLSIIAGLEQQTGKAVVYNSREWKGIDPEVSMVFQKLAPMPFKTAMENMELGLKFRKMSKGQCRELAQHYIELAGPKGFEKSYPAQLPDGMKQRVGIARVYATDPKLLIMDEPFGQLDAQTRYQTQEEVLGIWEGEKRTVIFVANNTEEVCYLGGKIILLSDYPATVREVYPISIPRPRGMVNEEFLKPRTVISDNTDLAI